MATVKLAHSSPTAMTVTNLHALASSATAGWQSAAVDNSTDLYLDALVQVVADMANTAPANDRCLYLFAYGAFASAYTNPASGSEGAITLTNITTTPQALRLIGVLPYTTTDEVIESQPFSVAQAFGGLLPPKWGLVLVNYSGAALAASGSSVTWVGVSATVA